MAARPLLSAVAAFGVGVAVELRIGKPGGEAWDSETYWIIGLPLMFAAALAAGALCRRHLWLIGYAPFAGQVLTMLSEGDGDYSLLPVGLILTAIVGLPGVAAAHIGAALGKRLLGTPS